MQRIVVLGIPGAGKSTLARRIGESLEIPVHHLDRYYWNSGWKASAPDDWLATLEQLIAGDSWILDGNYRSTIPLRLERADTAVYLDVPRSVALGRVGKRIVTYRDGSRPDMADGCPERWFDTEFLRYIWRYHRDVQPQTMALLEEFATRPGTQVIRLGSNRSVETWLRGLHSRNPVNHIGATD
jgi:adenylate kinase family enzyme